MSRSSRKTCFISYAHEDIDRDSLEYFIFLLKNAFASNIDVLTDAEVNLGDDLNAFMDLASNVDAVILILTPAYKRRVQEKKGGVFYEFSRLIARHDANQDLLFTSQVQDGIRSTNKSFQMFPVLFSGTRDQSVPTRISSIKSLNLIDAYARRKANGEFIVSPKDSEMFGNAVKAIAAQVYTASDMRSPEYITRTNSYVDLFVDLKARWDDPAVIADGTLQNLFVKTNSYELVAKQQVFFIVGRKGSGKSTILQTFHCLNNERSFCLLNINADQYNLEGMYALYSSFDFENSQKFFPQIKGFEMTWEAVIFISALRLLVQQRNQNYDDIEPIIQFLNSLTITSVSNQEGVTPANSDLFNYCFSRNLSFIRNCISKARSDPADAFLANISMLYNLENFLNFLFGSDKLQRCRDHINAFQKTLLVSLDGFDDAFDSFRVESMRLGDNKLLQSRASFELDWLRSLLSFTLRAYQKRDNLLYSKLEFCIVAPLDRFLEVAKINRDSYRAIGRWHSIEWSGIELSILLRKRLEHLLSVNAVSPKDIRPEDRLAHILCSPEFNDLPFTVNFEYNDKPYEIPLFLYVLRHTFWRPREVLIYYARLLALLDTRKRWGTTIDMASIRSCIKTTAEDIIQSEFISEFRTSLSNIDDVLRAFRGKPNILNYNLLSEILSEVDFQFSANILLSIGTVDKVSYLYQVGFLGIHLISDQVVQHGALHEHAFVFNEGMLLFRDKYLCDEDLASYSFLVHPIFCEFLKLDVRGSSLTLVFDWEYLHRAESALRIRQMSPA